MIRINLLPIGKAKKTESVQNQLFVFAVVVAATLVACIAWERWMQGKLDEKVQIAKAKEQELKQLDKIIGEVNEYTAKKKELESKLDVIQQLKKGKSGPVRALDDLATEIPKRVWLTGITDKNGAMTISGYAIDHEDVSAFMKSLEKSKYFSDVVLGFSKATKTKEMKLYSFKITCKVNYAA